MYAIVEIAGQQFKVEKDRKVYVHRLAAEEGSQIEFDNVLLIDNNGKIQIGTPKVEGAKSYRKSIGSRESRQSDCLQEEKKKDV